MLPDELSDFIGSVLNFLLGHNAPMAGMLFSKHNWSFQTNGDYSFPNILRPWKQFLNIDDKTKNTNCTFLEFVNKTVEELVQESKKWRIPLAKAEVVGDKVNLYFDRGIAIRVGLLNALKNCNLIAQSLTITSDCVQIDPACDCQNDVTSLRVKYMKSVMENLYVISTECREWAPRVFVTSRSTCKSPGSRVVVCGPVLSYKTGTKETAITAEEFLRTRQTQFHLIAQQRFGARVSESSEWKDYTAILGEASATYDLVRIKPSSPVKIDFQCPEGATRGIAFVLYNCARLDGLRSSYNQSVASGIYPPLPDFEDTDFSLLSHQEEWGLILIFALGMPLILNNTVTINETQCDFRPSHVCIFLSSLVKYFSKYYSNIKVLTEPRPHLMPVMFARIHMLKVIHNIIRTFLSILNIAPMSEM